MAASSVQHHSESYKKYLECDSLSDILVGLCAGRYGLVRIQRQKTLKYFQSFSSNTGSEDESSVNEETMVCWEHNAHKTKLISLAFGKQKPWNCFSTSTLTWKLEPQQWCYVLLLCNSLSNLQPECCRTKDWYSASNSPGYCSIRLLLDSIFTLPAWQRDLAIFDSHSNCPFTTLEARSKFGGSSR